MLVPEQNVPLSFLTQFWLLENRDWLLSPWLFQAKINNLCINCNFLKCLQVPSLLKVGWEISWKHFFVTGVKFHNGIITHEVMYIKYVTSHKKKVRWVNLFKAVSWRLQHHPSRELSTSSCYGRGKYLQ